ncbi:hypothetical protein MMC09_005969 [Bachmanniomyces sp. S44760]|nr:hypothetical protein [Bachmanniomyces sp. S44760]
MRVSSISHSFALSLLFSSFASSCPTPKVTPPSNTTQTNDTASLVQKQAFWAGADIGTVVRAKGIPGRVFYDFDGTTVKDPIQTLGDVGVNAFRVEGSPGQCLGPTTFSKLPSPLAKELTFSLNPGCYDTQVETAQQATALGMKFVLTINQGLNIPEAWLSYNYAQMVAAVKNETKRQLQPFLDVKLVPDVILLENEGTSGFLMRDNTTGHTRGNHDDKASAETVKAELCGQKPSGNIASYPQLAGFYKAEIQACNEVITGAELSIAPVRYGLHSHGQYVQWKESLVHGPKALSETVKKAPDGTECDFTDVIPQKNQKLDYSHMPSTRWQT